MSYLENRISKLEKHNGLHIDTSALFPPDVVARMVAVCLDSLTLCPLCREALVSDGALFATMLPDLKHRTRSSDSKECCCCDGELSVS